MIRTRHKLGLGLQEFTCRLTQRQIMARNKTFPLRLTPSQLETLQHLLERAAPSATPEQMLQLEGIDTQIYRLLFPALVEKGRAANREHPFSLGHLRTR